MSDWRRGNPGVHEFPLRYTCQRQEASEALNQAVKCMREIEKFKEVKHWAPFVLIGDDVNLDFKLI